MLRNATVIYYYQTLLCGAEGVRDLDACFSYSHDAPDAAAPAAGRGSFRLVVRAAHNAEAGAECFLSYGAYGDSK